MKHILYRLMTKATIFATVFLLALGTVTPIAYAAAFDDVRMTQSRMQISTNVSTTFTINLPSGVNWDATTASDTITLDFPAGYQFGGTWTTTDIVVWDSSTSTAPLSITDANITQSATAGTYFTDAVCVGIQNGSYLDVAVNTTDDTVKLRRCGGGGAQPVIGQNISITLNGSGTPGGILQTPAAAANDSLISINLADEDTTTYTDLIATAILDVDSVGPSAVPATAPTLQFELAEDRLSSGSLQNCDAAIAYASGGPVIGYTNPLSTSVINNATSTICATVTSTAGSIITVYGYSANGGLKSGATYLSSQSTTFYTSASEKTITLGTSMDDGICMVESGDTGAAGTDTAVTSTETYRGTCNWTSTGGAEQLGTLPKISNGAGVTEIWSLEGTGSAVKTHILPRVAVTTSAAAGTYTDTYYFLVSAAF